MRGNEYGCVNIDLGINSLNWLDPVIIVLDVCIARAAAWAQSWWEEPTPQAFKYTSGVEHHMWKIIDPKGIWIQLVKALWKRPYVVLLNPHFLQTKHVTDVWWKRG